MIIDGTGLLPKSVNGELRCFPPQTLSPPKVPTTRPPLPRRLDLAEPKRSG